MIRPILVASALVFAWNGDQCQTWGQNAASAASQEGSIRFNFSGADWSTVLNWLADEADLSLQLDDLPGGSFKYVANETYTIDGAIEVVNYGLLRRGFILVRRSRMLILINLESENADRLISEVAELVSPSALESRGKTDVVNCVFSLGSMTPDAARDELGQLIGPWGRVVVLESARRVKITETAEKLIAIRDVLEATESADVEVVDIELEHRGAEELLEIARPLVGLEVGEYANDDIRLSVELLGNRIYATGRASKITQLKKIIELADKPLVDESEENPEDLVLVLKTYEVTSADLNTVEKVLQTNLSEYPDCRMTVEPNTGSLIIRAFPKTHEIVAQTLEELDGSKRITKTFKLNKLDPAEALLTINKYFETDGEGGIGPIVDGYPDEGKIWVRGTNQQIRLIEELLQQLDGESSGTWADRILMIQISDRSTADAIERAVELWPMTGRKNSIRIVPSKSKEKQPPKGEPESDDDFDDAASWFQQNEANRFHFVSTPVDKEASESDNTATIESDPQDSEGIVVKEGGGDIVLQFDNNSVMIASEDEEALRDFEELVNSLRGGEIVGDGPVIKRLKYAEAEPTAELISQIIGGGESSLGSVVDSATSGMGGGILGGLMSLAGGGGGGGGGESTAKSVLTASGSVSIVPDARLNTLFIQANPSDLALVEFLIEQIDLAESPENVQIGADPVVIPVIYQDAEAVAEVVKKALGSRIEGQDSGSGGGGGRGGAPSPQDLFRALRGGGGGGQQAKTKTEPPKINIAVDTKANAIVVVATPQDVEDVQDLVAQLDEAGKSLRTEVVTIPLPGDVNPEVIKTALEAFVGREIGGDAKSGDSNSSGSSRTGGGSSGGSADSAETQRRLEFFRSIRERFSGGGGRGGSGGSPFGRGGGGGPGGGGGRGGRPGGGGR